MALVDVAFYATVYRGQDVSECEFNTLSARAEDVIGAMCKWQVDEQTIGNLPALTQTLYKKAVCAQIEFFSVNGLDIIASSSNAPGFTVGKVSVSGRSGSDLARNGAMADYIAPMALAYLEQTGLLNPAVTVAPSEPFLGWWC